MVHCFEANEWVVLSNIRQLHIKVRKNSIVEYILAIFCHNHNMIVTMVDAVWDMSKFIHTDYSTSLEERFWGYSIPRPYGRGFM